MTTASSRYSRGPPASDVHHASTPSFSRNRCGQRTAQTASTASTVSVVNQDSVGSLSFSPHPQRQPMVPYVMPMTRLTAVPSTSCRALTFTEVPVHRTVTEEELAAAEAIQGLKMGGFSPFTSPMKDTPLLSSAQNHFAVSSQPGSTPTTAAATGGAVLVASTVNEDSRLDGSTCSDVQSTMKTFSTGSGDDSVLSATDLETAAYVSIPRPVSQARRKLNLDGLCSPPFKSIVSEKCSPDNDFSNDGMESQRGDGEGQFKTPQGRGRRRRGSSTVSSVGSSPLLSPSPKRRDSRSPNSSRFDSSLYLLTSKFIELMNSHADGLINLNEAAVTLCVPKRRIYDITNVLEGIGFVEKSSKNCCKWGPERNMIVQSETESAKTELNRLIDEEKRLDDLISSVQGHLTNTMKDAENSSLAYIRYEDLRNTEELLDKTVIAVKAPADTLLEVPDPGETGTFQMMIRSQTGQPVEVFLCPERPVSSKPPSTGYYASEEFLEKVNENTTGIKQEQVSASHLGVYTSVCSPITKHDEAMETGEKTKPIISPALHSAMASTSGPSASIINGNVLTQFSPKLGSFEQQLLSPSTNGPLPFLSLDPPPEPDDYLFALGPYEGATELFDMYVGGSNNV